MASLLNTMQNNATIKQGGQIQDTSQEELQNLAQQAGMPTTPASPLSAQGIGANADQAKMVGTPAQDTAAIRLSTQQSDQLATQMREAQARKEATAAEQAEQKRALSFEGFGSLGQRVQQIADKMIGQSSAAGNLQKQVRLADETAVDGYLAPGADKAATVALLNKLGDNTVTDPEMVALAKNLGYTDVSDLAALKSSIGNQFLSQETQTGKFVAEKIPDNVSVSDFSPDQIKQIGFDSVDDMAAALQVDPAALKGMTIRQLQDQFGKEQIEDFGKAQKAQGVIADPSSSRAEKEQALLELRELGATGVRAAESDVKRINDAVAKGDEIKFNGQSYSVGDLLKDDTITGIVKQYLTDPDTAATLKKNEPQFAQWIDDNKKIMAAAAAQVDARQEQFATVQLNNMKIADTDYGKISDEAMKSIIPDFGKLTGEPYAPPPFISMLKNKEIPDDVAVNMVNTVNDLAHIDPIYSQSFAGLSKGEISALRLNTAEGMKDYRNYVNKVQELATAAPEEMTARIFEGVPQEALQKTLQDNIALRGFGLGGTFNQDYALIDRNGDGVPDTGEQLKNNFLSQSGGTGHNGGALTVRELLDAGRTAADYRSGSDAYGSLRSSTDAQIASSDLFQKYGKYWQSGALSVGGAAGIGNDMLAGDEAGAINKYYDIERLENTANMGDAQKNEINWYKDQLGNGATNSIVRNSGAFADDTAYKNAIAMVNTAQATHADVEGMNTHSYVNEDYQRNMDNLSAALTSLTNAKSNSTYRGADFQNHIGQKITEIGNALTTSMKKISTAASLDLNTSGSMPGGIQTLQALGHGLAQLTVTLTRAGLGLDVMNEAANATSKLATSLGLPADTPINKLNDKIQQLPAQSMQPITDLIDNPAGAVANTGNRIANVAKNPVGSAVDTVSSWSDRTTKKNIKDLKDADFDEFFNKVKPKSYEYKDEYQQDESSKGPKVGFVMQDVAKTKIGRLITREKDGKLAYDPQSLQGVLVAAVKKKRAK